MAYKKLIAIGEALIDFIPQQVGVSLKSVEGFTPKVGGAPANVCGAFSKLGGDSMLISKLGKDAFGERILDTLSACHIDVSKVVRTDVANTALAFVSLEADGNRDFSFYRKPSADMLLEADEIDNTWFDDAFALHFCSVALVPSPMKEAHLKAIECATGAGCIVSFDPNVRFPLWESKELLRQTILEFIPKAHVLKISDEELEFITGATSIEEAKEQLFVGNVKLVIYTKGGDGAEAHTKTTSVSVDSKRVKAVDTTGAGDGFIGALLFKLMQAGMNADKLEMLTQEEMVSCLAFAHHFCGKSVQREGAIDSYPTLKELEI